MNASLISDVMQLIPALQSARKFWMEPKVPAPVEREAWIAGLCAAFEKAAANLDDAAVGAMASETGASAALFAHWDLRGSLLFLKRQVAELELRAPADNVDHALGAEHLARGVLVLMQSRLHPLRLMFERLVPALLAGNSAVLKFASETPLCAAFMAAVLEASGIPSAVARVAYAENADLDQILVSHPAVAGLSVFDTPARVEELFRQSFSLKRSFQAWTGGRTTLLLLEPVVEENLRLLLRGFLDGSRWLRPYDVSRLFVLETQEAEMRAPLEQLFQEAHWITGYTEAEGRAYETMIARLKEEEGRLIAGGEVEFVAGEAKLRPALVLHLPQCSEYHQEDPVFPILLLGSVKYGFDTAKWVNNASRGFAVQIYGPIDKIEKLAGRFEVGRVLGPRGYEISGPLLFGIKESAVGLTDLHPTGLFFSQERRVDGSAVL